MVSFLFYFFNAKSSDFTYFSTLLTLTTYYPFLSVLSLSFLDLLHAFYEWNHKYKHLSELEFTISWEKKKEAIKYKWTMIMAYLAALSPFLVMWWFSYGKELIGVGALGYTIFAAILTFQKIYLYDGPAHKGLQVMHVPRLAIKVSPLDDTSFVISTLYTICYLISAEESTGKKAIIANYSNQPKYSHIAWRLVENLSPTEADQLRDYLVFSSERRKKKN